MNRDLLFDDDYFTEMCMDSFHDWIIFIRILGIMIHHYGLKFISEMIDMCII